MKVGRRLVVTGGVATLAGCAAESVWAPDEAVARAAYRHPGPPALTLFTTRNAGSGNGAHSGLMVNASQRVLFDPAGSFGHSTLPERDDVIYGMTPRIVEFYTGYHARTSFYVVEQTVEVDPQVAERVLRIVEAHGPVAQAFCTRAVADVLQQVPELGVNFRPTWFPDNLEEQFARVPGVVTVEHRQTDSDSLAEAAAEIDAALGG